MVDSVHDEVIKDFEKDFEPDYYLDPPTLYWEVFSLCKHLKHHLDSQTPIAGDIQERKQKGLETYKKLLTPNNGRNALQDAYEELLDLLCYLKQYELEILEKYEGKNN